MSLERRTPLKRSEQPLARKAPLKSASQLARKPIKKRRSRSKAEFTPAVRKQIRLRSGGLCEARTPACRGRATHMHHIARRRKGDRSASNGLDVCTPCHLWIHAHVAESYELGFLQRVNVAG